MKKYRFITNQISGVPNGAIRMLNPNRENTQTWLKLKFIEEIKEVKKVAKPVKKEVKKTKKDK